MDRNEKAAESLLQFLPFMHEKFLNPMERLAFHRLSKLQFFALMLLNRKGPLMMSELASVMQVSKQQLTPLVDRLMAQNLVERYPDPQDRRVIRIGCSQAGEDILDEMRKQNREALAAKLSILPDQELQELDMMILRVREILEKAERISALEDIQRG